MSELRCSSRTRGSDRCSRITCRAEQAIQAYQQAALALARHPGVDGITFNYFTSKDVVRHPLVAKIIEAYDGDTA